MLFKPEELPINPDGSENPISTWQERFWKIKGNKNVLVCKKNANENISKVKYYSDNEQKNTVKG